MDVAGWPPTGAGPGITLPGGLPGGLLYARGFLLVQGSRPAALASWREYPVGDRHLYVDPRVPVQLASSPGRRAWLVGDAFDPEAAVYTDVLRHLLTGDLLERLDAVAGRFLLIVEEAGQLAIYHDAMGARSIFYGGGVVASHAALVADALDAPLREWILPFITSRGYFKRDVKYLPGLETPFDGVRQLTPNTRLLLPQQKVERYWPRKPLQPSRRDQAVDALVQHLAGLRAYLEQNGNAPIVGLSAGRDSRGVLAAVKSLSPRLFTFVRSKDGTSSDSTDSSIARQLASRCGLEVEIVRVRAPSPLDAVATPFASAFRRNTGYVRGSNVAWIEHFAGQEAGAPVFVRGSGGEVMRGFYRKMTHANVTGLANTYDVNAGSRYTRDAFRAFLDVANWTREALLDYELSDIFYWEHRMGIWGASSLAEADMAFRAVPGYNSRNLFRTFMGLPQDLRASSDIFTEGTLRLAPELSGVPYDS